MQKTILVVEDDADLRIFLRKILTDNNFRVLEAADGAEALDRVEKEVPDLVLLDFLLPVVSGEAVCVKIKQNYPQIEVVALTEKTSSSDVIHGLQIGADDYISKPFVAEELIARIDTRLKKLNEKNEENHSTVKSASPKQKEGKLLFRESIVLIVLRLIVTELIFGLVFVLSTAVSSFVVNDLGLFNTFSLHFLLMLTILAANIVVVLFITLKWESEYTELTGDSLIKHRGIFYKHEKKYACNFVEVITIEQSLLGMIFDYGTIELYDPALKEQIYLVNIANPKKYREVIEERVSRDRNQIMPFVAK